MLSERPANKKVALDTSYSYICKSQTPKAWILSECVKKGVKPGPGMLKLWNGEDLSLDDGRLIRPSDVIRVETHCAVISKKSGLNSISPIAWKVEIYYDICYLL